VISPASRAIRDFRLILELLEILRDVNKAYRSLYIDGKILYRDISKNNIIIINLKEVDSFIGILINKDLTKEIDSARSSVRY